MKIVHLIDYFSPKLGYQETYLAKEQMRLGHDVTVVTSERYFPFPDYKETVGPILGQRLVKTGVRREEGVTVHRLPVLFEVFTRCFLLGLEDELIKTDPDVIHIHSVCSLSAVQVALFRKKLPRARILCDDHSHYSVILNNWSKKIFYGIFTFLFSRMLSKRIDAFVAITEETRDIMKNIMKISKKISVIELGADTNMFCFDKIKRGSIRKKLGLQDKDFVIMYAGKIIPQKGVHILIDAFHRLHIDDGRLIIVGNGDSQYIKSLNQAKDIIWIPMVLPNELPAYYSAADVGVWPKQESISMIEASACGLPIIIKESASMRKRVKYGNGLLYKEDNVSDLAKKLHMLYANRKRARQMGINGRKLVEEEYSWRAITRRFLRLYV